MKYTFSKTAMGDLMDFMKSVGGSFNNAGFISCKDCPNPDCKTRDFVFAPDFTGRPILIKRLDVISIANDLEPEQYKFIADSQKFLEFYRSNILWNTDSDSHCPLLNMSITMERESVSNSDKNFAKSGKDTH